MENLETTSLTAKREITNEAFAVLLKNVYAWMTLALGITGVAALYVSNNQVILTYLFEHIGLIFGLIIGDRAAMQICGSPVYIQTAAAIGSFVA